MEFAVVDDVVDVVVCLFAVVDDEWLVVELVVVVVVLALELAAAVVDLFDDEVWVVDWAARGEGLLNDAVELVADAAADE